MCALCNSEDDEERDYADDDDDGKNQISQKSIP